MIDMQDKQARPWGATKAIPVAAVFALALLYGGYQVGKDLALRDIAKCEGQ